jgi:hypothetical protein
VIQKDSRKVLHIPLDTLQPVDAEVYQILHGLKSSIECKNYLMNAVLYYSRSPLLVASNALVESLGQANIADSFSGVYAKLDVILETIKSSHVVFGSPGQADGVSVGGGYSSGEVLDANTKAALASLKQKFKV